MAKRNRLSIEVSGFAEYAEKLDRLGGDLKSVINDALEQAAETVEDDTREAVAKSNLPAGGEYSNGDTESSIISGARVTWHGPIAEIGVGFDKSVPGAGGFLISGTPKMSPDYALEKIYSSARYKNQINKDIIEVVQEAINEKMGG